ncbi:DNA primase catalytic subunit PriS [Candidatus Micrarchaeota archaeon]|nr:MAG: DNA primase catalytic subunit PriS [Candidatus Micrarchaeota archaeon]
MENINFIKEKFREYYKKKKLSPPPDFQKREFGFGDIKKIDYRHVSFSSVDEFRRHFVEKAPLYASYSAAYYEFPSARPMQNKKIIEADLIFEFDAKSDEKSLTPVAALEKAKEDTIRLIEDFLVNDFGISKSKISVNFSGSRGYHIHVFDDEVKKLNSKARRDIVRYIKPSPELIARVYDPSKNYTWHNRIKKALQQYKALREKREDTYKEYGINKREDERLMLIIDQLIGNKAKFDIKNKSARSAFEKLIKHYLYMKTLAVDEAVTFDMSRLIRIPNTLHGGSSLLAAKLKSLDKFNPYVDAVVFYNPPIKIKVLEAVSPFELREVKFGPFKKDEIVKIPEYAAMYLICKGVARPYGV